MLRPTLARIAARAAPLAAVVVVTGGAAEARRVDPSFAASGAVPARASATFSTRGAITRLAADGRRAVVMTTSIKRACGRVVVWTPPAGKPRSFKTEEGCPGADDGPIPFRVTEVALGGGQVAWIEEDGGSTLELTVHVARLSGNTAKQIEFVTNGDGLGGDPEGEYVGRLLGAGPLLAYNRWTVVCNAPPDRVCGSRDPSVSLSLAAQALVRIVDGRRVVVSRGPGACPLAAVGGGRMVVSGGVAAAETGPRNCLGGLGAAGAVSVLGPTGSRVATVPALDTNPPRAIALSAKCLALQRTATLDLYDPATGAATGSLPLGAAAALRLVAVNSRLALLRGTRRLVLVRLSDGELLVFPLSSVAAAKLVGARLTEAGLFYAYNLVGTKKGRIVFEPTARLLSRF